MKKIYAVCLMLVVVSFGNAQSVSSPEHFLGYKIGTHFTPHFKILNYFNAVAQARPDMVKIEKYGETYEGRDLVLTYIALPENLKRLDEIRLNNLRLANVSKDKAASLTDGTPAIVWLSYNVHGNEPASSEAAMLTLFALVDPNNSQTKEWLKNTIIIIDPCINPDGRDRYVNWYNTTVGKNFNPDPQAREHTEPWPRGRSNHYNFDLNRDWAWQTQQETQQRLKKYNQWLPQVHVDFHEQGYNQPYYFAPAAEPYHEVITNWQRDFQVRIGKNNAKYFDANGWLYFTKERFDLFYPSYGDTYPIYNGAIGMTFEQGGISAGLGVINKDEDTLTLIDRTAHHFTTGISTIEIASKNAVKLLSEYKSFFDNTSHAVNTTFKTYVLTTNNISQLNSLATLLDNDKIEYGITTTKNFKGINYFTGKEENYSDEGYQLAISAYQPKGALVKVLFEQKSMMSDSTTYDITAWSLPYAYGIKAYAVKEKLDITSYKTLPEITTVQSNYGVLIPYNSLSAAKALAYLLKQEIKVRFAEKPFSYNGKNYNSGTLIILKGNNRKEWNEVVNQASKQFNLQADEVESGFMEKGADFGSPDVHFIHTPKIAMLTGTQASSLAAGQIWHFFEQSLNYPLTQLIAEDIKKIDLSKYNVLIIPDGNYKILEDKNALEKILDFIKAGGKLIALENAVAQLANSNWGLKLKEDISAEEKDKEDEYSILKKYGEREKDDIKSSIPGAIYKVELDNTHPLAYGYPNFYYTLKQDKQVYEFLKDGWNVGVIKKDNYTSGFVGSRLKPKLKNGLVFGTQGIGKGSVVYLADDPMFRLFWENGKLLFCNAIFLVGQ